MGILRATGIYQPRWCFGQTADARILVVRNVGSQDAGASICFVVHALFPFLWLTLNILFVRTAFAFAPPIMHFCHFCGYSEYSFCPHSFQTGTKDAEQRSLHSFCNMHKEGSCYSICEPLQLLFRLFRNLTK